MKNILVFSAIGDMCNCHHSWSQSRDTHFKCAYTYYGSDVNRKNELESSCDIFNHCRGTKYQLFSKIFESLPIFDYYAIIDDDLNITGDQIKYMVDFMEKNRYGVSGPTYSSKGKRSGWGVMNTQKDSTFRECRFVEMGAVIFSREEMIKFISAFKPYEDVLLGWGIDHIIHSVCRHPFIVFDDVSIINPTNKQKNIQTRELENYCDRFRYIEYDAWKKVYEDLNNDFKEYKQ